MGANLRLLLEMPLVVLGLTLLLVAVKLLLLIGVGRWVGGLNSASALRLGMVLAAGGEFASWCSSWARTRACSTPRPTTCC